MAQFPAAPGLGTLLRHLVELLDGDVEAVYAAEDLDCRSRFTPVIRFIEEHGPHSIKAIARSSGLSHSAVSQTVSEMLKKDLVLSAPGQDGRERIISFSEKGEKILPRLHEIWAAIGRAAADLSESAGHDLGKVLQDVIAAAEERSFEERIRSQIDAAATAQRGGSELGKSTASLTTATRRA